MQVHEPDKDPKMNRAIAPTQPGISERPAPPLRPGTLRPGPHAGLPPANAARPRKRVSPRAVPVPRGTTGAFYRAYVKRAFDVVAVLLAMPLVLPVMAVLALLLRLDGGAALYSQRRLGQHGSIFRVWKFRTMVSDADARMEAYLAADPALRAEWNATQKLKNDPRITPLGRWLRKSSLDELPQLFNILRGDMSLVGPRPMMVDQLEIYGPLAPHYFALRPGLTGLWQISDRNTAHFTRRAEIDAEYERNVSFAGDLRIILATFAVVVRGTGY